MTPWSHDILAIGIKVSRRLRHVKPRKIINQIQTLGKSYMTGSYAQCNTSCTGQLRHIQCKSL